MDSKHGIRLKDVLWRVHQAIIILVQEGLKCWCAQRHTILDAHGNSKD